MILQGILIAIGFVLLIKGADWLVEGASTLAKKYKVSDMVIGLTIVAFGTSTPELVVNSIASIGSHSDIVYGNIIGSNIVNLFLILGIVGIIYPIRVPSITVRNEMPISILAVGVLYLLSNQILFQQQSQLSRIDGLILLLMFAGFLYYVFQQMKKDRALREDVHVHKMPGWKIGLYIFGGLTGLVLGGKLVVDNAVKIATVIGVSEKIIGLTIVAIGTSLPELVTSVVAALKKNSDIALGNIIGSNIFNVFFILSVSSFINPVNYNTSFNTDLYLLGIGTLMLFVAMFTGGRRKLDRWEAAILLAIYLLYTGWLIAKEV
ncbi:MAG TPA: sodium:proton exchanger [Prolixibacteraceae bacterium]|nr:sodium:proton exchanger [Prolixibacteraceae bacterium]